MEQEKIHPELAEIALQILVIFGQYRVESLERGRMGRRNISGWVDYFTVTGGDPEIQGKTETAKSTLRLLFGNISEIQIILYKGFVTIHPLMLEDIHMEAWAEVVKQYGDQIMLYDHSKEVFLR